jgi:hypothetical protein
VKRNMSAEQPENRGAFICCAAIKMRTLTQIVALHSSDQLLVVGIWPSNYIRPDSDLGRENIFDIRPTSVADDSQLSLDEPGLAMAATTRILAGRSPIPARQTCSLPG